MVKSILKAEYVEMIPKITYYRRLSSRSGPTFGTVQNQPCVLPAHILRTLDQTLSDEKRSHQILDPIHIVDSSPINKSRALRSNTAAHCTHAHLFLSKGK